MTSVYSSARIGTRVRTKRRGEKPRTARLSAERRRAQLLGIAAQIVRSGGAGSLTMEHVAQKAGVTIPVVYRHFENRADLLLALLDEHWHAYDRRVRERTAAATSYPELVRSAIGAYFDSLEERGPTLMAMLRERTAIPELESRRHNRRNGLVRWWAKQGKWRELNRAQAEAIAAINLAACDGAGAYWLEHRSMSREWLEDMLATTSLTLVRAARAGGLKGSSGGNNR